MWISDFGMMIFLIIGIVIENLFLTKKLIINHLIKINFQ
jgi:hypothetical protein